MAWVLMFGGLGSRKRINHHPSKGLCLPRRFTLHDTVLSFAMLISIFDSLLGLLWFSVHPKQSGVCSSRDTISLPLKPII